MAIKLMSTKDVKSNGVKVVLAGSSGAGKTVMAATAPNPIFISAEKGLLSLADKDIPYLEVKTLLSMDEAYKFCRDSEYETIILDSLSEITTNVLDQHKRELI